MKPRDGVSLDLDLLTALGFGPDAVLIDDPRLFANPRLLSSLILELEEELDPATARAVLFQIGLMQGLRHASRILNADFYGPEPSAPLSVHAETIPLAIRFGAQQFPQRGSGIELPGSWPELFEAEARRTRIGPTDQPSCLLSAGYTSGWLSGTLDADILVLETECACSGDLQCRFIAREVTAWRTAGHHWIDQLIASLSFADLRHVVTRDLPVPTREMQDPLRAGLDPSTSEVQLWGPVMVLPFTDPDALLQIVDQLGRDPETCNIRVVVLDLRDRILNENFDAVAIEVAIETIESWGAEVILTGVSPLSEDMASEAVSSHLLLRKSLPEAIAAAFQVAEAQRHLL